MYTAFVTRRPAHRPRIVGRILFVCLLSALLPLLGLSLGQLLAGNGDNDLGDLHFQLEASLRQQGQRTVRARASAISLRLKNSTAAVRQLSIYAEEVLRVPQVYGSFLRQSGQESATEPGDTASKAEKPGHAAALQPPDPGQAVENPLFYLKGQDGALRKALDDKQSALFFQARPAAAAFSAYDMQRVYATATLDPLLKSAVAGEPLVAAAFIVTSDNLLRTYPYVDTAGWPASKEFTKLPMYAFSPGKANAAGVVWTSPYVSQLSKQWVVACLRAVNVGGKQVGVVGLELAAKELAPKLLDFSLGDSGYCWLQSADGLVLASQAGGDAQLRVVPIAAAALPSEKMPDSKIKAEAELAGKGPPEIIAALSGIEASPDILSPVGSAVEQPRFLGAAEIDATGWKLCGVADYPELGSLAAEINSRRKASAGRWPLQLGSVVLGVLLGLTFGFIAARRLSLPLSILNQRLRKALAQRSTTPLAIADDGEVGALAATCQELLDRAFAPTEDNAS